MIRSSNTDIDSIVADINDVLRRYGIAEVTVQDVVATEKSISDIGKEDWKLSGAITNYIWPSVQSAYVCHYTTCKAAESILNSKILRLTNIGKRANEGEIEDFCVAHCLDGYLEVDGRGAKKYITELMPQLFYASFTEPGLSPAQENKMWNDFGQGDGVRLTFKIRATNQNFRKIVYANKSGEPIPLLKDLAAVAKERYGRCFVLQGVSRLCAFYLARFAHEKEYRALFKVWDGFSTQPVGDGKSSYVEVPLAQENETGYFFEVIDVCSDTRPDMPSWYPFTQRSR